MPPNPAIIAAGIGAASDLIGGFFDRKSSKEANAYNRELNQNKIAWTVADAKRAGVHPLAALGSPVAGSWATQSPDNSMGQAISSAGGRASQAIMQKQANELALQQQAKQNELIDAQVANLQAETARINRNAIRQAPSPDGNPQIPLYAEFGYYDAKGNWVFSHYGQNPQAFETGITELGVGGIIHGGAAATSAAIDAISPDTPPVRVEIAPPPPSRSPTTRSPGVAPYEQRYLELLRQKGM